MLLLSPSSHSVPKRLLCLSNGHGEDAIAVRILQALQQCPETPELAALPLVGEGKAYQHLNIPVIGTVKSMPSGGFIYMDGRQLARDLQGGLLQLTLAQWRAIRQWARQGGSILAVGDIFPLLLARLSGLPYAFVGTAKSEYYLRDESGHLFPHTFLDGWSGSVYYPWERWLMSPPRCRAVFPRDSLTTQVLQKWRIPAFDLGNPMMDGLEPQEPLLKNQPVAVGSGRWDGGRWDGNESVQIPMDVASGRVVEAQLESVLKVLLLPGSRIPEAYENWQKILQAVNGVIGQFVDQPSIFLGAIAPSLSLEPLSYLLVSQGWHRLSRPRLAEVVSLPDASALWFGQGKATLVLTQHSFGDCLHQADWAIAMAGTATEQFVGLGKPAITMPGKGPQFTPAFAEAQTRLLGESVIVASQPSQVATLMQSLIQDTERLHQIAANGHRRMGQPGSAARIAQCLMAQLGKKPNV